MSPTVDTAVTIALFVLGLPVLVFFGFTGFVRLGMEIGPALVRPPKHYKSLELAAKVVPPLLLGGTYLGAIVLASMMPGLTFYYPLIAVPVGVAAGNGALSGLIGRLSHLRSGERTVQDVARDQAWQRHRDAGAQGCDHAVRNAEQAIAAVTAHIRKSKIDYPTTGLVADPFEAGWSVYAPVTVDASDPTEFRNIPVGRAVFLIGAGGRIEQTSSAQTPQLARQRFIDRERTLGHLGQGLPNTD